jgi:hypothetical protein
MLRCPVTGGLWYRGGLSSGGEAGRGSRRGASRCGGRLGWGGGVLRRALQFGGRC